MNITRVWVLVLLGRYNGFCQGGTMEIEKDERVKDACQGVMVTIYGI